MDPRSRTIYLEIKDMSKFSKEVIENPKTQIIHSHKLAYRGKPVRSGTVQRDQRKWATLLTHEFPHKVMCNCSVHVSIAFIPLSPCTHNAYLAYDLISSVWPCSPRVKLSPSASNLMIWEWNVRVRYHCTLVLRLAFGKSHPITWTLQMVISVHIQEAATKKKHKLYFHRYSHLDSHSALKFDQLKSLRPLRPCPICTRVPITSRKAAYPQHYLLSSSCPSYSHQGIVGRVQLLRVGGTSVPRDSPCPGGQPAT